MDLVTIKARKITRSHLRIIAAVTGEQMIDVLDRLCLAESERVLATLPDGKTVVIHGSKKEGNIYVDRLAKPLDDADEKGTANDDTTGSGSTGNT